MNLNQITLPALDVGRSVAFYQALGLTMIVDAAPRYARLECKDGGSTLSLHETKSKRVQSDVVIYFECQDLDSEVERLTHLGIEFDQSPRDEGWLWREARLRDPSNNTVCLYWAGSNRRFPPWRTAK